MSALEAGTIDLALLRPPVLESEILLETIRRDRLIVLLPDGHPLTRHRRLRLEDLRDEDVITHAGHGRSIMHDLVVRLAQEAGFELRVRHEVSETSTLVTFVAAGLGVAVVPKPVAALGVAGTTYRPLSPASLGVDLLAATRRGGPSPQVDRALVTLRRLTAA